MPVAHRKVSIFDEAGAFVPRVHMKQRKRDMTEEGLASQPQEHGRIFSHRPEHRQMIEMLVGFPENVHTLIFQLAQVFHKYVLFARSNMSPGSNRGVSERF